MMLLLSEVSVVEGTLPGDWRSSDPAFRNGWVVNSRVAARLLEEVELHSHKHQRDTATMTGSRPLAGRLDVVPQAGIIPTVTENIAYRVRFPVDDRVLSELHHRAFGSFDVSVQPWRQRLVRHSLGWLGAFHGQVLVGFVNLCWDGGAHAFVLDTAVHPNHQCQGIGRELVHRAAELAAEAGCQWLHVDYEPQLRSFYRDSCGFRPTEAGLISLTG